MKFRSSFVTNSSSSSFICEICGETHSGWDLCASDVGGGSCVNGHEWCGCIDSYTLTYTEQDERDYAKELLVNHVDWYKEHPEYQCDLSEQLEQIKNISTLDMNEIEDIINNYSDGVPAYKCPICSFATTTQDDMCRYLYKKYNISRDEVFDIIKSINKRRRKLYDNEYINYIYDKFNINEDIILKEIKAKFKSYEEFSESL